MKEKPICKVVAFILLVTMVLGTMPVLAEDTWNEYKAITYVGTDKTTDPSIVDTDNFTFGGAGL